LTRHRGSAILDFPFFLKSQEIMEIYIKSSQNACELYKLVNFGNLMKKTGKKYKIMSKKLIFWPNLHETCGCYGNIKNDGHKIDISKYRRRMNEQLMKVLASPSE